MFRKHRYYGFIGLFFIALSFVYWYLPINHLMLLIFNSFFYLGNILFFDFLSFEFSGFSLLHSTASKRWHFLLIGAMFGLILEFYVHWVGKFWYYPFWDTIFYTVIFIPGFAVYFFYLLETYLGTKALFEHFFLKKERKIKFEGLKRLFIGLGFLGIMGLSVITTLLFVRLPFGNLNAFLSVNSGPSADPNQFYLFLLISIFLWLILEYLEYERHETSMLLEAISGNPWPVLSVFVASWGSAILYEVFNVPGGLWRYSNLPFSNILILGVPIIVLLTWPFHYFPFFSLYRLIFRKETERIWD